jgi:hypothetical protein
VKFNESLKQYINRIYGSSTNPLIEASINQSLGKKLQKSSLSQVRKILNLKESFDEPSTKAESKMQFDGRVFRIIEADSNKQRGASGGGESNM